MSELKQKLEALASTAREFPYETLDGSCVGVKREKPTAMYMLNLLWPVIEAAYICGLGCAYHEIEELEGKLK